MIIRIYLVAGLLFVVGCSGGNSDNNKPDDTETSIPTDSVPGDSDSSTTVTDGTDDVVVDSKGIEWVRLAGGTFLMGRADTPGAAPEVDVTIKDFYLMKTEVTIAMYTACIEDDACTEPDKTDRCDPEDEITDYTNWGKEGREFFPVSCITWQQASNFCIWAGGRLPSESEWEYAARGGSSANIYPWGEDEPSCDFVIMEAVNVGCDEMRSWEVCSKPRGNSEQGLCDMAGNVAEIVQDWIVFGYEQLPTDGTAYEGDIQLQKGARGGSFLDSENHSFETQNRSTVILDDADVDHSWAAGMRCAK